MKKELFAELVESIKEGSRILKGAAKPKRSFKFDEPDVCAFGNAWAFRSTSFPPFSVSASRLYAIGNSAAANRTAPPASFCASPPKIRKVCWKRFMAEERR